MSGSWWSQATIYQVYPRSFQDSDGDGVGDLEGIRARLAYLAELGVDALWLSPIYSSPNADLGYDVSDFTGVDPVFGSLEQFDAMLAEAHERGLRVLLDFVPSHTSIEHPWFRDHPERYVWSDRDGPPNNWLATFGGPAWSRDERSGRWYLHSFYPEQPDLDWRNPEVRNEMSGAIRFWADRGVDGFRLDAIDRLIKDERMRDDPPASRPFPLPHRPEYDSLEHVRSSNDPEIGIALAAIREAAPDLFLVGEVYLPSEGLGTYLPHLDAAFAFELLHSPFELERVRSVLEKAQRKGLIGSLAWVLSNHDFPRLVSRLGHERARLAAMLLLTLPGTAFIYQGDEIGMADGPGADPPIDRADRDPFRHPMQWDATPSGGFSIGKPWLPMTDPADRNVADQESDPGSLLHLYRSLIALRGELGPGFELLDVGPQLLAYRRGEHLVALNFSDAAVNVPPNGELMLGTDPATEAGSRPAAIGPFGGVVLRSE
jgi:alpha-glucosidase